MNSHLQHYLSTWRLYKRTLIAFLAISVFSVALSAVLAFNYFGFKRDLNAQQKTSLDKIARSDRASHLLNSLLKDLRDQKRIEIRSRRDEERVLQILTRWQELKTLVSDFSSDSSLANVSAIIGTDETISTLSDLETRITTVRNEEIKKLEERLDSYHDTGMELILTGLITLLFGIILPNFLLYMLGRTVNNVRQEMQKVAMEFIKSLNDNRTLFGDEAFKNVEFWLQSLLIVGHQASRVSTHPAAQVAGELAHLVQQELKRKRDQTAA